MSINKHSEASEALNADCTTENQLGSVFPPERKSNIKSSYISGYQTDDQKDYKKDDQKDDEKDYHKDTK